jgi:transposase InsO family protein
MRDLGLEPCQPKPWRCSRTEQDSQTGPIPDLVNRDFTVDKPGQRMVGYITYIDTREGWVYRDGHRLRDPQDRQMGAG